MAIFLFLSLLCLGDAALVFPGPRALSVPAYTPKMIGKQDAPESVLLRGFPLHPHLAPPDSFDPCIRPTRTFGDGDAVFIASGRDTPHACLEDSMKASKATNIVHLYRALENPNDFSAAYEDFYWTQVYDPSPFDDVTIYRVRYSDTRLSLAALGCTGGETQAPAACAFDDSNLDPNATFVAENVEDPWFVMFNHNAGFTTMSVAELCIYVWVVVHTAYALSPYRKIVPPESPARGVQKLLLLTVVVKGVTALVMRPLQKIEFYYWIPHAIPRILQGVFYVVSVSLFFQLILYWYTLTRQTLRRPTRSLGIDSRSARIILAVTTTATIFQVICECALIYQVKGGMLLWFANTFILGFIFLCFSVAALVLGGKLIWKLSYGVPQSARRAKGGDTNSSLSNDSGQALALPSASSFKKDQSRMESVRGGLSRLKEESQRLTRSDIFPLTRMTVVIAALALFGFLVSILILFSKLNGNPTGVAWTQTLLRLSDSAGNILMVITISPIFVRRRRLKKQCSQVHLKSTSSLSLSSSRSAHISSSRSANSDPPKESFQKEEAAKSIDAPHAPGKRVNETANPLVEMTTVQLTPQSPKPDDVPTFE